MSQLKNNAKWLAVAQVMKVLLQLISMTVLARLLEPRFYGLMAMVSVVMTFAWLFRDLGTSAAVIQAKDLSEDLKNAVFWVSGGLGCCIFVCIAALSPALGKYFSEPDLPLLLILVAISFPLSGFTSVHQALAERRGHFKVLATIEVMSNAVGLCVAIFGAWVGWGVYALVAQNLVIAALTSWGVLHFSPWRPRRPGNWIALLQIANFSKNLVGFNFINFFSRNADALIIGRFVGAAALGIYNMGVKLMLFPLQSVTYVSSRALFPVLSRAQDDLARCQNLYLDAVRGVSLLTFPLMLSLWSLREDFVPSVLGERWLDLIPIVAWLAPTGMVQSINSTTGTVFMALGRTEVLFRLGILGAILNVSAYWFGSLYGLTAVAMCYFMANVVNCIPNLYLAMNAMGGGMTALLRAIWPALCSSGCMSITVACARILLPEFRGQIGGLMLFGLIGVGVYFGVMKFVFPDCFRVLFDLRRVRR